MPKTLISPSILSADFGHLQDEVDRVSNADMLHIDVMDGHFVDNITFGAPVMRCIKTKLPMNAHLMIENPEKYIKDFADAGASIITIHAEVCPDLKGTIAKIKKLGVKAGVCINPDKELSLIEDVLEQVDYVLLMTVFPGFGGQKFIREVLPRIKELRKKAPDLDIGVDGGINGESVKDAVKAGANDIIAGSYVFGSKDARKTVEELRKAAEGAEF